MYKGWYKLKSTGIVRRVDQLGRIVIPKELRKITNMDIGAPVEIFMDGDFINLRRYQTTRACVITGEMSELNKEFAPGLVLSPQGADILFNRLEKERKDA
ncbi:AbrB family transcriptional regulator [Planococcus sp. MB-3u-09]|nr:AbrB family transcriptional regulator [Planococcus sp. MB-3u-03]PKG46525.1 AbrB family transcriptional regulator [Planococcus sp. Urea-trap-24]PKG89789.1 AbrB family transcriptional regulator [Planococcus sp. Urea-3u-39]PKH40808.1 AbrB family transcriptional regulator [Planococcus sp. MB-3u-09]